MKNITRICLMLIITFVISACSKASGNTSTYVLDKDGQNATVVLTHKDDDVNKIEVDTLMNYEQLGIQPEMKGQMEQAFSMAKGAIKAIKGLDLTVDFKEKNVSLKFSVDYTTVDMNQLKGLSEMAGGKLPIGEFDKLKSLKTVESELLKAGFVKK